MNDDQPDWNIRIRVHFLWPAGYSCGQTETFPVRAWAIREGCLILIRGAGNRTHIPLTSIAKWEVGA